MVASSSAWSALATPALAFSGVVAHDRSVALFAFVRTSTLLQSESPPMRLDGLDPSSRYVVTRLNLPGETPHDASARSGAGPTMVLGSLIMGPGLEAPHLPPEAAALFHLAKQES